MRESFRALADMVATGDERGYTLENGFYVIEDFRGTRK
jgi:hypothetical protein